jgi:methylated-DNA-[protein]-cysteine S-methyltransferase
VTDPVTSARPVERTDVAVVDSAVGPIAVECDGAQLLRVRFAADAAVANAEPGSLAARLAAELAEYFAGERTEFTVEPDWTLVDETSARVLAELVRRAPFGRTVSYGELAVAAEITDPIGARVVGQVLNANPWPVLVPCHRVVMADGSLGGFGSGVWRKEALLRHEGVLPATLFG